MIIFKKLLVGIALLLATVSAVANNVLTSPVQVIDFIRYGQIYNDFNSRQELKALRQMSFIIYDKYVNRPWGDEYLPEAQKRWDEFRLRFCHPVPGVCALPEKLSQDGALEAVVRGLQSPEVLSSIDKAIKVGPHPFYFERTTYLDYAPEPNEPPFYNVLVSGMEYKTRLPQKQIWDMPLINVTVREKEYVLVYDVISYRRGYTQDQSTARLLLGDDGQPVVNIDVLKNMAMTFAPTWKQAMERPQVPLTFASFDDFAYQRLGARWKDRLQGVYRILENQLRQINSEFAKEALGRFRYERSRNAFPEEVYQFVAFEIFRDMIRTEGRYFATAAHARGSLNFLRKSWENLLTLQKEHDPAFVLFLVYHEALYDLGGYMSQFAPRRVGFAAMYEYIKAIIEHGEFAGRGGFARFGKLLQGPELLDVEYLKTQVPSVYKELWDESANRLRDIRSLAPAEQKRLWAQYVHREDGKLHSMSIFRLMYSIIGFMDDRTGKDLAQHVHDVRASEFARQSR